MTEEKLNRALESRGLPAVAVITPPTVRVIQPVAPETTLPPAQPLESDGGNDTPVGLIVGLTLGLAALAVLLAGIMWYLKTSAMNNVDSAVALEPKIGERLSLPPRLIFFFRPARGLVLCTPHSSKGTCKRALASPALGQACR